MPIRCIVLASLALTATACTPDKITVCPSDLQFRVSPRDTTIASGQRFTVQLSLFGCAGTQPLADSITFASSNADVAVVDAATGVVVGRAAGSATVHATAHHYGITQDVPVTVR